MPLIKISKYKQIFQISLKSSFVYRLNFIMWRVRVLIGVFISFIFWKAILSHQATFGSYSMGEIFTYILGTSFIRSVVFSSQSIDAQAEISSGDLNNYLVKPLNYFGYWFSKDLADKLLNVFFSIFELLGLYILFRPSLSFPTLSQFGLSLIFLALSTFLYFWFSFLISLSTFWIPEGNGWPQRFFIITLLEFFSGGLIPLDLLPKSLSQILQLLPTAYFQYIPMQIFLHRFNPTQITLSLIVLLFWLSILLILNHRIFTIGRQIYSAYGR